MSPDQQQDSCSEYSQTSSSCLGPEPKMDRPTTARMGQQAAASIRNWILATRCHGRFFGRKTAEWPRNEPGTFQKVHGTALNGFRRVPERNRNEAGSPSPPPPSLPPTHQTRPQGRGPTSSLSWMVSLHQRRREGRVGSTSGHKSRAACCQIVTTKPLIETQRVNRKHASLPHDKTEPNSGSVSDCVRRQGVVPFRPAKRLHEEQRTPLRSLLKMQQSPRDITLTPELTSLGENCFGRPSSQSDAHLRCALRATGLQPHAPWQTRLSHQSLSSP